MAQSEIRIRAAAIARARGLEERAIQIAGGALLLGFVVGFIFFFGRNPGLSGPGSIGLAAAIANFFVALLAFAVSVWRTARRRFRAGRDSPWLYGLDLFAVALAHGALAYLGSVALFAIFHQAFLGLTLDHFAAGLLMAITAGLTGYLTAVNVQSLTTERVATLLAMFLSLGVLNSMMNTNQQDWWQQNISALGTAGAGAASNTFNLTLFMAGLLIVALAHYILDDMKRFSESEAGAMAYREIQHIRQESSRKWLGRVGGWMSSSEVRQRYAHPHLRPVYICLVLMGAGLTLAGFVPVDEVEMIHNLGATGMVIAWGVLICSLPWWIPGLGMTFHIASAVFVVGVAVSVLLFIPLGYYNLTAMELIAFALIFTWLILFIRQLGTVPAAAASSAEGAGAVGSSVSGAGEEEAVHDGV